MQQPSSAATNEAVRITSVQLAIGPAARGAICSPNTGWRTAVTPRQAGLVARFRLRNSDQCRSLHNPATIVDLGVSASLATWSFDCESPKRPRQTAFCDTE